MEVVWLRPSTSIAVASEMEDRVPVALRYPMRGLGSDEAITELVSDLLFEAAFCQHLIGLGRADVAASREQVESFFPDTVHPIAAGGQRAAL